MEAKDNIEFPFDDLRQGPTQNIAVITKEFDSQARTLEVAGGDPISPEQLAFTFLEKLNQVRHGDMLVHLLNIRSPGGVFFATANDAFIVAKDWRSVSLRLADSCGVVANGAALCLQMLCAPTISSSTSSNTRRLSGAVSSKKPSLLPKKNVQSTSRIRFASQTSAIDPTFPDDVLGGKKMETRTCYKCRNVGHVVKDFILVLRIAVGDEESKKMNSVLFMRKHSVTLTMRA